MYCLGKMIKRTRPKTFITRKTKRELYLTETYKLLKTNTDFYESNMRAQL